uniref:Uncharacterized protein n=1 Tax=Setaria viridis TaxID=4556 RepID=A0A4U6T4T4_SETVI|nr:hypothetical protein SEVIR_9G448450v2 [Setaria viridis]
MDGQDGDSKQKTKPHGNPYPKRGSIKKQIIKDWTGGSGGGNDSGGDASSSGSAAAGGYYGAD